jgi:hypothetical protein
MTREDAATIFERIATLLELKGKRTQLSRPAAYRAPGGGDRGELQRVTS